jgi:hypothetical protein
MMVRLCGGVLWLLVPPPVASAVACADETTPPTGLFDGSTQCHVQFYRTDGTAQAVSPSCAGRQDWKELDSYLIDDLIDWPDHCVAERSRCYAIPEESDEGLLSSLQESILTLPRVPASADVVLLDCVGEKGKEVNVVDTTPSAEQQSPSTTLAAKQEEDKGIKKKSALLGTVLAVGLGAVLAVAGILYHQKRRFNSSLHAFESLPATDEDEDAYDFQSIEMREHPVP